MSDYISREAAIAAAFSANGIGNSEYRDACDIAERLRKIPAADVVEVVRCRDCKHWFRIKKDCILASCDLDALVRHEDFFCASGARMVSNDV